MTIYIYNTYIPSRKQAYLSMESFIPIFQKRAVSAGDFCGSMLVGGSVRPGCIVGGSLDMCVDAGCFLGA